MNILAASMQAQGPRSRQEDAVLCEPAEGVFGVFDGLGGHDDGDKNSAGAARLLLSAWREAGRPLVPGKLDEAWSNAREALEAEVRDGDTTATVGWLVGDGLLVMHAGDCSVLRYRNGEVVNLVERHGFGHVVTNTFRRRSSTSSYPDIERVHLAAGDLVIFATDGLEVLTHDAIAALLGSLSPGPDLPKRAASLLVNAALASDATDNVSVVVLAVA